MAVLRRISYYFILVIIDLHYHLVSAQTAITREELCAHIEAGTLCTDSDSQVVFPNPEDCSEYYECGRRGVIERRCVVGRFDYIDLACTFRSTVRCMPSCTVATTVTEMNLTTSGERQSSTPYITTDSTVITKDTTTPPAETTVTGTAEMILTTSGERQSATPYITTDSTVVTKDTTTPPVSAKTTWSSSHSPTSQSLDATSTFQSLTTLVHNFRSTSEPIVEMTTQEAKTSSANDLVSTDAPVHISFPTTTEKMSSITPVTDEDKISVIQTTVVSTENNKDVISVTSITTSVTSPKMMSSTVTKGETDTVSDSEMSSTAIPHGDMSTVTSISNGETLSTSMSDGKHSTNADDIYSTSTENPKSQPILSESNLDPGRPVDIFANYANTLSTKGATFTSTSTSTSNLSPSSKTPNDQNDGWFFHTSRRTSIPPSSPTLPLLPASVSVTSPLLSTTRRSTTTKSGGPWLFHTTNQTARSHAVTTTTSSPMQTPAKSVTANVSSMESHFTKNPNLHLQNNKTDNMNSSLLLSTSSPVSPSVHTNTTDKYTYGNSITTNLLSVTVNSNVSSIDTNKSVTVNVSDESISFTSMDNVNTVSSDLHDSLNVSGDSTVSVWSGDFTTSDYGGSNNGDLISMNEQDVYVSTTNKLHASSGASQGEYSTGNSQTNTKTRLEDVTTEEQHNNPLCTLTIPCTPNSKVGNAEDCTKYYECSQNGAEWSEYECHWMPFPYFDIKTSQCQDAQHATCQSNCQNDAMTTDAITNIEDFTTAEHNNPLCTLTIPCTPNSRVGNAEDCTKYYECNQNGNKWEEYECQWMPFSYFDIKTSQCQDAQHATCQSNCQNDAMTTDAITNIEDFTTAEHNNPLCTLAIPCTPNSRVGNAEDCTKYYECNQNGNKWEEYECQWMPFSYFDIKTSQCQDAQHATCQSNCQNDALTSDTITNIEDFTTEEQHNNPLCKLTIPCTPNSRVGNAEDCTKYYECNQNGNKWEEYECQWMPFSYFDIKTSQCQDAQHATCQSNCQNDAMTSDTITNIEDFTTEEQHNNPLCKLTIPCTPNSRVGNAEDCTKYYECNQNGNKWEEYECQWMPFSYFDIKTNQCQDAQHAMCESSCQNDAITTDAITTSTDSTTMLANISSSEEIDINKASDCVQHVPCEPGRKAGDIDDCSKYFECAEHGGAWVELVCEWFPFVYFDTKTGYCDIFGVATCEVSCSKNTTTSVSEQIDTNSSSSESDIIQTTFRSPRTTTATYLSSKETDHQTKNNPQLKTTNLVFTFSSSPNDKTDSNYTHLIKKDQDDNLYDSTNSNSRLSHTITVSTNILGSSETISASTPHVQVGDEDEACELPLPCESGLTVANMDNCNMYFECNSAGNQWLERVCDWEPFTHYNPQTQSCDEPRRTVCQKDCPFPSVPETTKPMPTTMTLGITGKSSTEEVSISLSTESLASGVETTEENIMTTQGTIVDGELSTATVMPFSRDWTSAEAENLTEFHPMIDSNGTISDNTSHTTFSRTESTDNSKITSTSHTTTSIQETTQDSNKEMQCQLTVPCIPGQSVGDKDDCMKYFVCNEDGNEWTSTICGWFPFAYFDTRTLECKQIADALCQEGCPDTGQVSFEITTIPVSVTTEFDSSEESGDETRMAPETSSVYSTHTQTPQGPLQVNDTVEETVTSSNPTEHTNITTTDLLGIMSESATSSIYSSGTIGETVDSEDNDISTKLHDTFTPTNSISHTSPSVVTHDYLTTYTNILGSTTETTAQVTTGTSEQSNNDDGPCVLPLPCSPGQFVGDKDDCTQYFECIRAGNGWRQLKCAWQPFTHYDSKSNMCKLPASAVCQTGCPRPTTAFPVTTQPEATSTASTVMSTTDEPETTTTSVDEEPTSTTIIPEVTTTQEDITTTELPTSTSADITEMFTTGEETTTIEEIVTSESSSTMENVDTTTTATTMGENDMISTDTTTPNPTTEVVKMTSDDISPLSSTSSPVVSEEGTSVPSSTNPVTTYTDPVTTQSTQPSTEMMDVSTESSPVSDGTTTIEITTSTTQGMDSTIQEGTTAVFSPTVIQQTSSQTTLDTSIVTSDEQTLSTRTSFTTEDLTTVSIESNQTSNADSTTVSSSGDTTVAIIPSSTSQADISVDACNRPEPCVIGDFLPDPTDCTKYYMCIKRNKGTMWQRRPCTANWNFDQDLHVCSNVANCHPGCSQNTTEIIPTSPGSSSQSDPTTESQTLSAESTTSEASSPASTSSNPANIDSSMSTTSDSVSSTSEALTSLAEFTSELPSSVSSPSVQETSEPIQTSSQISQTDFVSDRTTRQVSSGETTPDSSSTSQFTPEGTTVEDEETSGTSGRVSFDSSSTVIPDTSSDSEMETSEGLLNVSDTTVVLSTATPPIDSTQLSTDGTATVVTDGTTTEFSGTFSGDVSTSGSTEGSTTEEIPTTTFSGRIVDHSVIVGSGEALEGQNFQIQCSFVLEPQTTPYTLKWYLNDQPLRNSERIKIIQPTGQRSRRVSSVTFTPIYYRDSGDVSCKVTLSSGVDSEETMPVAVLPKPTITISQQTITSSAGQPISIQCESHVTSSSHPVDDVSPVITWYRNGEVIDFSDEVAEELVEIDDNTQQLQTRPTEDIQYSCAASNKAGSSELLTCSVTVIQDETVYCEAETYQGVNWTMTAPGGTNIQACPQDMIGEAKRACEGNSNGATWAKPNLNHCVDKILVEIFEEVERIEEGIGGTKENMENVTSKLESFTNVTGPMTPGDLNVTAESLDMLAHVRTEDKSIDMSEKELENVVTTISNLLNSVNHMAWGILQEENPMLSVTLMWTVDSYLEVATLYLPEDMTITVPSENVVLQADKLNKNNLRDVKYPQVSEENRMDWMDLDSDTVSISKDTLQSLGNNIPGDSIALSSSYYKNINKLLPNYNNPNDSDAYINSKVLAMSVLGLEAGSKLDPPIQLEFQQNQNIPENETGSCSFWDFEGEMWSTEGCSVVSTNSSHTSCQCNHLTNFAVLVSRNPVTGKHAYILSLISIIGCVISVGAMVLTILVYISIWKHVKSHHAVVLINLCIALIIANLLFVTGVNKTSIRAVCISVAVLLHYFYLAAFFLMLVEGIQLMLYIIYVFHVRRKRETAGLIVMGWLIPAVIVGICLGINKTEGYGTDEFCWLDSDTWLFWVFIVPAAIIIVINVIICVSVLRRISTSKIHQIDKSRHQKVKSAFWNIIVVMPILGITWLFGVFSVSSDVLAFQYIFAVSNSLQGLFIFIFHALCNKKRQPYRSKSASSKSDRSQKGKGRYQVKSSVRTQRSRLKSDSSGKASNKSSKSFKSLKDAVFGSSKSNKKKNSLSNTTPESPAYDEIPADFLKFDDNGFPSHKAPPQQPQHHHNQSHLYPYQGGAFLGETNYDDIDNRYRPGSPDPQNGGPAAGGYSNPSFLTFTGDRDPNMIDLSISENNNSDLSTSEAPIKKLSFFERLNSVNEMRTEEYMDIKLAPDNVRFRLTPKSSPRLPRSTPFLARSSPGMPVKSQTSFNC